MYDFQYWIEKYIEEPLDKLFAFPSSEKDWHNFLTKAQALDCDVYDLRLSEMKRKYPLRARFQKIPKFIHDHITSDFSKLQETIYFLVSHLIPSRRYHMLDLRQPRSAPDQYHYRWGWLDRSQALVLANFNLLREFVEYELTSNYDGGVIPREEFRKEIKREDCTNDSEYELLKYQRENDLEILAIYDWWMVDSKIMCDNVNNALHTWYEYSQNRSDPNFREETERGLLELYREYEKELESKEEEMLIRLIKIRDRLWT